MFNCVVMIKLIGRVKQNLFFMSFNLIVIIIAVGGKIHFPLIRGHKGHLSGSEIGEIFRRI